MCQVSSVQDSYTSYDEKSGNYYMWLVQRGLFSYTLKLDVKELQIDASTSVTVEKVDQNSFGEVTELLTVGANKSLQLTLPPQSVVLLTIPKGKLGKKTIAASADASVSGGNKRSVTNGASQKLLVQLDAQNPEKNNVAYTWFDLSGISIYNTQRVVLKVNGYTNKTGEPFRLHVYGIPSSKFDQQKLNWKNAPLLDNTEALIKEVGTKAFVAGELAFSATVKDHFLDVTELVKNHAGKGISFVFVRETRQLGDDEDKGKQAIINSSETGSKPMLIVWEKP
jgi:hypothetical protein